MTVSPMARYVEMADLAWYGWVLVVGTGGGVGFVGGFAGIGGLPLMVALLRCGVSHFACVCHRLSSLRPCLSLWCRDDTGARPSTSASTRRRELCWRSCCRRWPCSAFSS